MDLLYFLLKIFYFIAFCCEKCYNRKRSNTNEYSRSLLIIKILTRKGDMYE